MGISSFSGKSSSLDSKEKAPKNGNKTSASPKSTQGSTVAPHKTDTALEEKDEEENWEEDTLDEDAEALSGQDFMLDVSSGYIPDDTPPDTLYGDEENYTAPASTSLSSQAYDFTTQERHSHDKGPTPWERMEAGELTWEEFPQYDKERIVRHYAPKIRFLALRLKVKLPKNIELTELISAGTLGLLEALGKFQASLHIRFETYAENRIRGAMLDELRRLDWFPRSLRQRVRQLDQAVWQIEHEKGRPPTLEELKEHTGLPEKEISQGLEALQNQLCISLDAIQDSLAGDGTPEGEPYKNTALTEMVDRVAALIDTLTPREKLVLSLYYSDELNMRETADIMGITEGRVSQLHTQALTRLRREFHEKYGESGEME